MPQRKSEISPATLARFVLVAALLCVGLSAASPAAVVSAAEVELTATVQAAFDKTVDKADSVTAAKLKGLYADLGALLREDQELEAKIKALHYRNEEAILALRKQIRDIDADKLGKLETQVRQAKNRYQPLFDTYAELNKKIAMAKPLKNKNLNALLRAQADAMKLPVQYAREDIRVKNAALQAAKKATSATIKSARDSLAATEPLKVQVKSQRSAAALPRASLSPVWKNFKLATKNSETKGTLDALGTLVVLARQIAEQQRKIYALEVKIGETIAQTRTRYV
ncbi:hypothetical protein D7Z26_19710 [Cohnella endophytica]|uniref:Uncharacterized protein n=1 Tax=Cohnella endophytica TaxID=2419778 RepID=A0A494XR86_9BACL|nr:hypothetical protein [Cohnella endophytica]RKP50043.1 hypothetical protein D7Z26_19710 [Cohnella endophytica]